MRRFRTSPRRDAARGSVLLEALFGILIFSMGILALIGLQATSIKQVASGKYRTDASLLANDLVSRMWVGDRSPTALADNFATDAPEYDNWLPSVTAALPGAAANPPTVTVTTVAGSSPSNDHAQVVVTMRWKAPNEPASDPVHTYVLVADIK